MKTKKCIMVTIFIMSIISTYAQSIEIKGERNTYIQSDDSPGFHVVYNKSNKFSKKTPSYLLFEHIPPITVGDKTELDSIVFFYFNPIFKKYAGDFNEFAALKISLFSDINGNIKDIRIAYPSEVEIIPIKIFEEFEAAVLQSNVKLVFDKDHHVFQGTAWVGQYAIYDPEKLRKCKDEH